MTPKPDWQLAEEAIATQPKGYRLVIEAVGLRQSDAVSYALRLIGEMIQEAHTKGHCCGGETGNASGRFEKLT